MLSGDKPANAEQRVYVKECLYRPKDGMDEVRKFYEATTEKILQKNSHKLSADCCQIDIVKK